MSKNLLPLIGTHIYNNQTLPEVLNEAESLKCETLQFFLHSPKTWTPKDYAAQEVEEFKRRAVKFPKLFAHACYLLNLGSPREEIRSHSLDTLLSELTVAEELGLSGVIFHPGAHTGSGTQEGLKRVVEILDQITAITPGYKARLLLENTAGQGTFLCSRLEDFVYIFDQADHPQRLGICLDTCHLLAAGYDLSREESYDEFFGAFRSAFSGDELQVMHLNDSTFPLGEKKDRHQHIGKGFVGIPAFARLLHDPALKEVPMILETPKEDGMDKVNLKILRDLRKKIA